MILGGRDFGEREVAWGNIPGVWNGLGMDYGIDEVRSTLCFNITRRLHHAKFASGNDRSLPLSWEYTALEDVIFFCL